MTMILWVAALLRAAWKDNFTELKRAAGSYAQSGFTGVLYSFGCSYQAQRS